MWIPVKLRTKWLHKSFCRLYQILDLGNNSAELKMQIHLGRIFFPFSHFLHSRVQTHSIIYFCLLFCVPAHIVNYISSWDEVILVCLIFQQILHFCVEIRRCQSPFDWINLLSFPGICLGRTRYKKAWFQLLVALYKAVWKVPQTMQQEWICKSLSPETFLFLKADQPLDGIQIQFEAF